MNRLLLIWPWLLVASGCKNDEATADLVINEFVAANNTGQADGDTYPDWFEIYNRTNRAVSLEGWSVGKDKASRVPLNDALTIGGRGHLLLWADDDPEQGSGHVKLRLDADGETLMLFDPKGAVADQVTWGPLLPDLAVARTPDGGDDWDIREGDEITPNASNGGLDSGLPPGEVGCALELGEAAHATEGDPVSVDATCSDGGSYSYSWYGVEGGSTATWTWNPGNDDAGKHLAMVAVEDTTTAGVPLTAITEVDVADNWQDPNNTLVDPSAYELEWGVPVLHIFPDGPIEDVYGDGYAWFEGIRYTMQIKLRGAASAGYPKHNFTVEFDPEQLDLRDHGLNRKDHLVLISNFDDNSHLRQRLVYEVWQQMAAFSGVARLTPRTTPMVVYLDGEYHGLFLALDHVDDEFLREMGLTSGSNLYKSVSHDANFYLTNASGNPKGTLHDGWEKKEGEPLDDFADIEALTGWVATTDHAGFAADASTWLDPVEYMDWFHLVHVLACDDSAGKNAYLYNDPADGRFRYVPWDFNHALGQTWRTERQSPESFNDFTWHNAVFWHLQNEPGLASTLWDRQAQMRAASGPLNPDRMLEVVDAWITELGPHPERDWEKWEQEYYDYSLWYWRTDWTTPAEERAYLREWLQQRDANL